MTRNDWIKSISPFFIVFLIDQLTKGWASYLEEAKLYGLFSLVLHHNQGVMLGLFSELPPVLRVVSLSTLGLFLLCGFALIQYLLPFRSLQLRMGLSILIGGLIGNVFDRIRLGYVIDFITIGSPSLSSPVFNLADALQWLGYIFIVLAILKDGQTLWPDQNQRMTFWINKKFQIKYSAFVMSVGVATTIIISGFSYAYLKVSLTELIGNNQHVINRYVMPFGISFICLGLTISIILFFIGKYVSHRIAGPIYAFERFLKGALDGKDIPLKLRSGDEFRELEILAEQLNEKIKTLKSQG